MYHPSLVLSIAFVISSSLGPGPVDSGVIIDYQPQHTPADHLHSRPDSVEKMHQPNPAASHPVSNSYPAQEEEPSCPECEQERQLSRLRATHTEEEIHKLRIEHIKQQILRKLRLQAPPNITRRPIRNIPKPLKEIFEREKAAAAEDPSALDTDIEEFYGKKTEIIVFGSRINGCTSDGSRAACFHFELENKLSLDEMESAELYVYKSREHGRRPQFTRTLKVSDLTARSYGSTKVLAQKELHEKRGKWVNFDMKSTVKRWLERPDRNHGLQISCDRCSLDSDHSLPIHASGEKKPFLVIYTRDHSKDRKKRSSGNCPGESSCCMETFNVSFKELGWDSWILEPEGYESKYCKGNCRLLPSLNKNRPNQMLVHILQKVSEVKNDDSLLPCCAPTRMSKRSILYYNEEREVIMENLPNMVVESCGCT